MKMLHVTKSHVLSNCIKIIRKHMKTYEKTHVLSNCIEKERYK